MAPDTAAYPPFGGAGWCEWTDPHPPHLYADHGDGDETVTVYSCSGEGDFEQFGLGDPPDPISDRL